MADKIPAQKYDPTSQALHWMVALTIIAAYASGLLRGSVPRGAPRAELLSTHMSIGLLVLGLCVARVLWRIVHTPPPPVASTPLMVKAAKLGHLALYAAMIAVPVLGVLNASADGKSISFFGLFGIPAPIAPSRSVAKVFEKIHELSAHALVALAGAHAAIAIFHQWFLRDGTLSRMVPWRAH